MNKYFDNASTSYPKPREVVEAICDFTVNMGGSYGRSSYPRAFLSTTLVEECRDMLAERLGVSGGIAWAMNATGGSNMIISSLNLRKKKVLVSPLEHNCVMRPLKAMGAIVEVLPHFTDGRIDISRIKKEDAHLVVVNHQSNVNGVIQPIADIKAALGDTPLFLDTAQSLGYIDVELEKWGVDYAIFTAHKGLLGVTGVGGLYAKDTTTLKPLLYGGTGSNSLSYDMPTLFPEFMEAGTYNMVGIVGLRAALGCTLEPYHTKNDFYDFLDEVRKLKGIEVFCAEDRNTQGELFSFRHNTIDGALLTSILSEEYGIECRYGLHCSALAHRTLGTTESGTIRVAPSIYHSCNELDYFVESLSKII